MITEDYVSFDTAKLLKEKGFDEMTELAYGLEHGHIRNDLPVNYWRNSEIGEYKFSCPTLQMAMKWLREVHKIHVVIYPYGDYSCDNYQFDVYKDNRLVVSKDDGYITYEQSCEAAIKYCLENLI